MKWAFSYQSPKTPKIASEAIKNYGAILVCDTKQELIDIANQIAPEHLEVLFEDKKITDSLTNAGCIFLGEYSPEPLGLHGWAKPHTSNQWKR